MQSPRQSRCALCISCACTCTVATQVGNPARYSGTNLPCRHDCIPTQVPNFKYRTQHNKGLRSQQRAQCSLLKSIYVTHTPYTCAIWPTLGSRVPKFQKYTINVLYPRCCVSWGGALHSRQRLSEPARAAVKGKGSLRNHRRGSGWLTVLCKTVGAFCSVAHPRATVPRQPSRATRRRRPPPVPAAGATLRAR